MSTTVEVQLPDGLTEGGNRHTLARLRPLSIGVLMDATEAASKPHLTATGLEWGTHPALMTLHTLRLRLESIGDLKPVSEMLFRQLSEADLDALQEAADKQDAALAQELASLGKPKK